MIVDAIITSIVTFRALLARAGGVSRAKVVRFVTASPMGKPMCKMGRVNKRKEFFEELFTLVSKDSPMVFDILHAFRF